MKDKFLSRDFDGCAYEHLYERVKGLPIFDFHCHLSPKEIYEDRRFENLTQAWLGGDHYKWRLMREAGIDERFITGDADDREKFLRFAKVVPEAVGNPICVWSKMELEKYFGITEPLCVTNADRIYQAANERLKTLSARKMIELNDVRYIFTTDEPCDDLKYHKLLREDKSFSVTVLPTFRPDKAINIELPFFEGFLKLLAPKNFEDFLLKMSERVAYFAENGCVCSDHALDTVPFRHCTHAEAEQIFAKRTGKKELSAAEVEQFKTFMLVFLGRLYKRYGFVMQYHIGALRNNSARYMRLLGADTGFDAVNDTVIAQNLSALLNELDKTDELGKTILYCLNPRDNEVLASIRNCFQQGGIDTKVQFGSAWWFNDQGGGMRKQMETLAQFGRLSGFVGMLTDSRSFLSYPRHDYFRKVLCRFLADCYESEYPYGIEVLLEIAENICFNNANRFFFADKNDSK